MNDATQTLEPFVGQWAVLLTTYKRDGAPVGTAVNIVVEGDRAYFRTWDTAWKLRRIRNTPKSTSPLPRPVAGLGAGDSGPRHSARRRRVVPRRKAARQQVSCPARPPCPTGPSPEGQQDDARRVGTRGSPVAGRRLKAGCGKVDLSQPALIGTSARRHPDRPVEPDDLAVEHLVLDDVFH